MTKMTNAIALTTAIEILSDVNADREVVEKLQKMLEQTQKKSSTGTKKQTANQIANEGLKSAILEFLETGEQFTITDIMKGCEAVADMSNQKVSSLVRQLIEAKAVKREEIKRKAYFSVA